MPQPRPIESAIHYIRHKLGDDYQVLTTDEDCVIKAVRGQFTAYIGLEKGMKRSRLNWIVQETKTYFKAGFTRCLIL